MPLSETKTSDSIWCVIPVFNNGETILEVALQCREHLKHVVVVDDGSTDGDVQALFSGRDITVLRQAVNRGKGAALRRALRYVASRNAVTMMTLDGDGQHCPNDLEKMIPAALENPEALVVASRDFSQAHIPKGSKFGRAFANFWLRIEAGISVSDCQSGFRAYPVALFSKMKLTGSHYDFETEALAHAGWAGLQIKSVPVTVWYPEKGKRVSHFKPILDNARISWMHARLVFRCLGPWPHRKLVQTKDKPSHWELFRHPVAFIRSLLKESSTPAELASSAGVGILLAALPLLFTHTIAILYVTTKLHMNRLMALTIQNLCNPPFVPFLCIETGYFLRNGKWLTHLPAEAFLGQIPHLLWDWLVGSLIVGPVLALPVGLGVFWTAKWIQAKKMDREASASLRPALMEEVS